MLVPFSRTALDSHADRPRLRSSPRTVENDLVVGEWMLERAAWSDRHEHEEINFVIEGELEVSYEGHQFVARAGDVVIVPAGIRARYAAMESARMFYIYGPSTDGHASHDQEYEELD
jgi:quercetin dioxygenase-like cupin family protein